MAQDNSVRFGLCAVDAATGQFLLSSFADDHECTQLETALFQLKPKEIVVEKGCIRHSTMQLLKRCLGKPIVNAVKVRPLSVLLFSLPPSQSHPARALSPLSLLLILAAGSGVPVSPGHSLLLGFPPVLWQR